MSFEYIGYLQASDSIDFYLLTASQGENGTIRSLQVLLMLSSQSFYAHTSFPSSVIATANTFLILGCAVNHDGRKLAAEDGSTGGLRAKGLV